MREAGVKLLLPFSFCSAVHAAGRPIATGNELEAADPASHNIIRADAVLHGALQRKKLDNNPLAEPRSDRQPEKCGSPA